MEKRNCGVLLAACIIAHFACAEHCDMSLGDFPRLAGESDSSWIQRAVDSLPEGSLYIPRGDYRIASTIMITNHCSVELNRAARLLAVTQMPYVVKIDARPYGRTWNLFFRGGVVDGDGLASCMAVDGFSPFYIRNVTFLNGSRFGLRVNSEAGGGGLFADELYFRCTKSGLAGNTAFYSSGCDGKYSNMLSVDWTTGFRLAGGGNRMVGCHAWGGTVPPAKPGQLPEMLENSVAFHVGGWDNLITDCYADTASIGYLVEGRDIQLTGSWFLINPFYKMKEALVIDHRDGTLVVSDCHFIKNVDGVKVYKGINGKTRVAWNNMLYTEFPPEDRPGEADFVYSDRNLEGACCKAADDWEYVQEDGGWKFFSGPGEFSGKEKSRKMAVCAATAVINRMFPAAGPGETLVVRARATTPDTKFVELSFTQDDKKTWGMNLPLSEEWRETRIPLKDLRAFSHWAGSPKFGEGDVLDARKIRCVNAYFGAWFCRDSIDKAHGFEISSIRIVGR